MLSIKIRDIKGFKEVCDAIGSIIEEGIFKFDSDGVTLRAMDPSMISMVHFSASAKDFAEYLLDEPVNIGLRISDLSKVLGRAVLERADEVIIEKTDNFVELTMKFASKSSKFRLPILDISQAVTGDPKVTEAASVKIIAVSLKNALKNCELVSTYVTFTSMKDSFIIESKGDVSQYSIEYERKSADVSEIHVTSDKVRSTYPLEYLLDIMNGASDSSTVSMKYGTIGVLKLSYDISLGSIVFYLAPIREEE